MLLTSIAFLLLSAIYAADNGNAYFSGCEAAVSVGHDYKHSATEALIHQQCNELLSTYGSAVHLPNNDTNFIVWDAKQQEVRSACRVTPTSSQQVSEIIDRLTIHWCRFAVKSGSHARNANDSVSAGGVTIDLVDMKSVEMLKDPSWAKVGAGHVLGSLYTSLEAKNLSFVGGRAADVGLGGYLLGGGLSNWSPKYGLALDNILEYEVSSEERPSMGDRVTSTGCPSKFKHRHDQREVTPGPLLCSSRRHEQFLRSNILHGASISARQDHVWYCDCTTRPERSRCEGSERSYHQMER